MKKVYVIVGTTGEYNNSCEWNACAFLDERKAEVFCDGLNIKLKHLGAHVSQDAEKLYRDRTVHANACEVMEKFDKNFRLDYTGTEYEVKEIELRG